MGPPYDFAPGPPFARSITDNTKQKLCNEYFQIRLSSESGRKNLHHIYLKVWKNVPTKFRPCSFMLFIFVHLCSFIYAVQQNFIPVHFQHLKNISNSILL